MADIRALYQLMRADFLERVRRDSFLIVLGVMVFACYMFVPPAGANYVTLYPGSRRGLYNLAWLGLLFGLATGLFLTLFGFYLVSDAVDRDRQTGVGQIIAAASIKKTTYVLGKWLSNLAVLAVFLGVQSVMAVIMQVLRAEDSAINLWLLIVPIWSIGVPVMAMVAAPAILFECVPLLRGGFGNVVYFFLWIFFAVTLPIFTSGNVAPAADIMGIRWGIEDVHQQLLSERPDVPLDGDFGAPISVLLTDDPIFVWAGIPWTGRIFLERLLWLGGAGVAALVAALPFDRFDPARTRVRQERRGLLRRLWAWGGALLRGKPSEQRSVGWADLSLTAASQLTSLSDRARRGRFIGLSLGEFKLMVRRRGWLWYSGVIGLTIACLASPPEVVERVLIPAVWLWPILIWAEMGSRESRHNTEQRVFVSPHLATRQLPAMWLAGVLVAAIATSGAALYYVTTGKPELLLAWIVGCCFVPTLAMALSVWSKVGRLFEITYAMWWYFGLLSRVAAFDFAGIGGMGIFRVVYLAMTAGLLLLAMARRQRQIA